MSKKFLFTFFLCTLMAVITSQETGAIPNPASVNCIDKGGNLIISKRGDGGQYAICLFPDGRQCEEWALFRGECPAGGIAISDSLTTEEVYCLITGGIILEKPTQCQLPIGKICDLEDFYSGKCPRSF